MHKRKSNMTDSIYLIKAERYIGENTKSENENVAAHGKKIKYLEEIR